MAKKRIAIIGAGLGGLSAAVRLANAGFDVDVFEQNNDAGGKAGSLIFNGFRFDTGPSLLTMPNVLKELFSECGENLQNHLHLKKLNIICKYFYHDGSVINAFSEINEFGKEIERSTHEKQKTLKNYFNYCKTIYDLTAELFLYKSPQQASTYLSMRAISTLFQIKSIDPFRTVHQANSLFFRDSKIIQLFDRYATYNGSNPYLAPATLNIIPHVEYSMGSYVTRGGIFSISKALKQLAENKGVNFYFNAKVEKIEVTRKSTRGIVLGGKFYPYNAVLSNIDVLTTYKNIIDVDSKKVIDKLSKHDLSTSALVFYWGVKGKNEQLEVHNILFSEDYKKEFNDLFTNKVIHNDPTIYIYISSKYEPSDAPKDCENWFVMINTPPNINQNWEDEVKRFRKIILDKIKKTISADIEDKIIAEKILTPIDLEIRTGSYNGSIYGISSNDKFAAFLRHPNFSKDISGLYFCGGSVHPGGGIPLVILSGKIASDMIKKKYS
ncbi:MAG: phytoene desaturase [Ignavibacteriaceae bacterium]|nr:phytoene desaturase [Ignavibacteriaceae bacterium]